MAQVFVSIGSNIDRDHNIRSGVETLRHYFGELVLSAVYDSQAVGFEGDNFYNLVAGFDTSATVAEVSERLRDIENMHHRCRDAARFSPRTLDIDLLLYDDLVIDTAGFSLPRGEIMTSAFVLGPLAEIAGELRHPVSRQCYREMWQHFDQASQPMRRIEFEWRHSESKAES